MEQNPRLLALIKNSFAYQHVIFYGMGIIAALTGVGILVLSFAVPPKPGEENILFILQIVAVVFILFGVWAVWYVRRRESRVRHLIYDAPEQIDSIKSVSVQRRGVQGRAIRIYTKDKKMIGFNVNGPNNQQELMDLLRQHLQQAGVTIE